MATSNNSIQTFTFAQNINVRSLIIAGEPWFVAADVCKALELPNTTAALSRLDADEQALISIKGISKGNDYANTVNESGLYSLILGSRKPSAKAFKKWVTSEVLPAIRKTGTYSVAAETNTPKEAIQQVAALTATATGQHIAAVHKAIRERFNVPCLDQAHGIPLEAIVAFLKEWSAMVAGRALPNPRRKADYVELTIPAVDAIPDVIDGANYYTLGTSHDGYTKGSPIARLRKAVKTGKPIASRDLSGLLVEVDMLHSIALQAGIQLGLVRSPTEYVRDFNNGNERLMAIC